TLLEATHQSDVQTAHPADAFAQEILAAFEGREAASCAVQGKAPGEDIVDEGLYGRFNEREREILTLVAAGLRDREVAERLGMTEGTVKWYLQQVYDKIGTRRRQHAVERARQFGLIGS